MSDTEPAFGFMWVRSAEPTVWHLTCSGDETGLSIAVAHNSGCACVYDYARNRFVEVSQPGDGDLDIAKARAWSALVKRKWYGAAQAQQKGLGER